jgi:hypothetical protein
MTSVVLTHKTDKAPLADMPTLHVSTAKTAAIVTVMGAELAFACPVAEEGCQRAFEITHGARAGATGKEQWGGKSPAC